MAARIKFGYEPGEGGSLRPYLWLELGLEGRQPVTVRGLLDSGADVSVLPMDLAVGLGVEADQLRQVVATVLTGQVDAWLSAVDVRASLPGAPERFQRLRPLFVEDAPSPRWGRDFMGLYVVAFDEAAHQFSLYSD